MSEIITIEKVEEAKSAKGLYKTVTYGGGKRAACFTDGLLALLTVGATLEVEIVISQKGDKTYHNITAAKPSDKSAESPAGKPAPAPSRGREPGERQSIERQTALKAAVELAGYSMAKGAEVKMGDVLRGASMMARFLAEGWVPAESPAVAPGAPPQGTETGARPEMPPKTAPKPGEAIKKETIGLIQWHAGTSRKSIADILTAKKWGALDQLTEPQGQEVLKELKA